MTPKRYSSFFVAVLREITFAGKRSHCHCAIKSIRRKNNGLHTPYRINGIARFPCYSTAFLFVLLDDLDLKSLFTGFSIVFS